MIYAVLALYAAVFAFGLGWVLVGYQEWQERRAQSFPQERDR